MPCDHRADGSKRVEGIALNRTASTRCEKVQAFPALAMALFDRYGVFRFLNEPALQWQRIDNTILDVKEFIENRS